jgi:archaellum component FlaC
MSDNRPSIDERLDRIAELLDAVTGQLARLSEQMTISQQQADQRGAALDAKLDRIAETAEQQNQAIANLSHQAEQQTQAIATLTHQMGVMAETLTRVDLQLERLATVTENQSRISAEQAATTAALVRLVTVLAERSA